MEYDSGKMEMKEISQKLSNYKIPLKQTTKITTASKDSFDNNSDVGKSNNDIVNGVITHDESQAQQNHLRLSSSSETETFLSPLLNCELSKELSTSHIEYSRQQSFGSLDTQTKSSIRNEQLFSKKRKYDTPTEKPMFFGRDASYPSQLNDLIQPLYCNLCSAHLNSVKTAKNHYESKAHDKKITNWLNEWSIKSGEPIPKVKRFLKEGPTGPDVFHCEACDLPLTSLQHASQHYNGKKHRMVVSKKADPSGSGFYNDEGKWIRQLTKPSKECSPRFGIGDSFVKSTVETETVTTESQDSVSQDPSKYCVLCNISVTSVQQMEMHLNGTKHIKKLKQQGQTTPPPPPLSFSPNETILSTVSNPQQHNDISIYRTPSGNYYCKICDITFADGTLFQQHLGSKKHNKNFRAKSTQEQQNGRN